MVRKLKLGALTVGKGIFMGCPKVVAGKDIEDHIASILIVGMVTRSNYLKMVW
jgi:hypothetical protein